MAAEGFALLRPQKGGDLLRRQEIEFPLLAVAVGVLGAVKASLGCGHLPQDIGGGLFRNFQILRLFRHGVGPAVRHDEQSVVVQHFLKVGDQKTHICGVAAETIADVVKQTASVHLRQGVLRHFQAGAIPVPLIPGQQKQEVVGRWKFRRAAEAAVLPVVGLPVERHGVLQNSGIRRTAALSAPAQLRDDLLRLAQQQRAVTFPLLMDGCQQLPQPDHAAPAAFGEIGPGEKRLLLRRHKDAGGPAAAAGKGLTDRHIDAVDVRPLLLVHLDGDEPAVQERGNFRVFKALVSHHMAPVAGAVPDTQEYGLILGLRPLERLSTPGIPVHGVFCVLEQVGT